MTVSAFWTRKTERAALQVAEDALPDTQIAEAAGVSRQTLDTWKKRKDFKTRVAQHVTSFAEAITAKGIAERQNRVDALNERWRLMRQVIADRAADETMKGAGHETGLLVRTYKPTKTGRMIEEYAVDTGLLAELRAHEQQAAKELGQWAERRELTGKDGGPIQTEQSGGIEVRAVDYRLTAAALKPDDAD